MQPCAVVRDLQGKHIKDYHGFVLLVRTRKVCVHVTVRVYVCIYLWEALVSLLVWGKKKQKKNYL